MTRKVKLSSETVDAMVDTFTMVCFFLEDFRMNAYSGMSDTKKEIILKWCVDDADYATFRQHGYYIRDIFA